jgi:hypothetical protein
VILVDTSVWVDHLRTGDKALADLLDAGEVLIHPFVIGELALGDLRQRQAIVTSLQDLPMANIASDQGVLAFIQQHVLWGAGLGYIDAHLLTSAQLTDGTSLWTRDKHLLNAAQRLGLARPPEP